MQGYEVEDGRGGRAWWDGKKLIPLDANGFQMKPGAKPAGLFGGTLSAQDQKTLAAQRTAAQNIRGAREQAYEFVKRNADTDTGGLLALDSYGEYRAATDPELGTLQGLSNAMVPGMHVTPGPMTDADAKLYRSAIPSLARPRETNRELARNIARKEQQIAARTAFMEKYAARLGSLNGAEAAFNSWWTKYSREHPFMPAETAAPAGGAGGGVKYLGEE